MTKSTFIAYASGIPMVREAVNNAIARLRETASELISPMSWEELDIPGRFIATEVLTGIDSSEFTVADISRYNFNVVYEIGYSIGRGKRVLLVRHASVAEDELLAHDLGLAHTVEDLRTFRIDVIGQKLCIYTRISRVFLLVETLDEFQRNISRVSKFLVAIHLK